MTIVYEPTLYCVHQSGVDLPSPANHTPGTIARCDCGWYFRRYEDTGYAFWRRISERRVRRILKRAAKQKGEV